ncbi:putative apo-citrate lyase phosphoribosyl-dephospho-CoA transferase [Streptococcus porcinus]|uniref:citrate lyase holo-[acyl-carrier protein] synthase n=2 Tax=Streptococcus porcinus TaxID=1340 RepID=A0A4V0HFZ4_STRPO|nr:putative apo-citrate lyase phosphoribosyl-dephospho-CoA transferase [Streptococcus porcinus]VTT47536.1 putative apo-citrate lyase phosphoribosyl-dephospho-CoA transferase [Streptococcus porcinus]
MLSIMSNDDLFVGEKISLEEMMEAREQRSFQHFSLLKENTDTNLLSVTMNIPGPIKTSPQLLALFEEMIAVVQAKLADQDISYDMYLPLKTGAEYYLLTNLSATSLKERMIALETENPLGRLFDLDVLTLADGHLQSISRQDLGLPTRRCYVCSEDAKVCGRSRKHSIEDMQKAIQQIIASTISHTKEE